MKKRAVLFWSWLKKSIDSPWYSLMLFGLAMADILLGFIPTDGLLVSSSAMRPRRWLRLAIWTTIGNVVGAAVIAGLLVVDANWILQQLPTLFESTVWQKLDYFLENYGLWTLWIVAVSPFPILPVLVSLSLAGVPFASLVIVFTTSRIVKFGTLSWIASHSPKLLKKLSGWWMS